MNSSYIGKVFDNYRLLQNLGKGGMGLVFKAVNIKLDRLVALKMIAPGLAMNSNFIKRFQTEAKALAKLENPHIVRIYDMRSFNDQWFIVMEYIEGTTLSEKIRNEGALPWKEALVTFKQMMLAIDHAHQAGIIHRDIKPSNVIITPDNIVKVMDFGLAKDRENLGVTQTVSTGGTLFYMSPEQVKGLLYTDLRSDVYSLGLTLYEMLVGKTPFTKNHTDFDIRETIVRKKFPAPREVNSQVPESLDAIVMKAIQKEPDARFQTVKSMQRAIEEFEKYGFINSMMLDDTEKLPGDPLDLEGSDIAEEPGKAQPAPENTTFSSIQRPTLPENENRQNSKKLILVLPVVIVLLIIIVLGIQFEIPQQFLDRKSTKTQSAFSITGQPDGAQIVMNGDSLGVSPLSQISAGSNAVNLRIYKKDFFQLDTVINFSENPDTLFEYRLTAAAAVPLKIFPAESNIQLDQSKLNLPGDSILTIPAGNHRLLVSAPGYLDREFEFAAKKGNNAPLEIVLEKEIKAETARFASLKITSNPSGARVMIDNKFLGTTPLNRNRIIPGVHNIKISKKGYSSYSNSLTLSDKKTESIDARLRALNGSLKIVSNPADAELFLDGKKLKKGRSGHNYSNIRPGKRKIELRKKGYKNYSAEVDITADKTTRIEASLETISAEVAVLVKPWGSIRIDNQLIAENTNLIERRRLDFGKHKIVARHPSFGQCEKTINILDEKAQQVTIDFNRFFPLVITAFDPQGNPVWGDIFVDGKAIGAKTPKEIQLRSGVHKIAVKKDGYTLVEGEKEIMLDENFKSPQKFTLRKSF